jgi:hypothetical protein
MKAKRKNKHQRKGTRFSKDGRTVFVMLRVDRRSYEFARWRAALLADADPGGTAEDQLEGYQNMGVIGDMDETGWKAPPQIEALYRGLREDEKSDHDLDDGIPF